VLELLEHVAGGVEDRAVHRRRREQRGGHELGVVVGDTTDDDVADERREPDLHRQQIQQRLEEARHEDHPGVAVEHHAALDHALRPTGSHEHLERDDAKRDRHGANLRPNAIRQAIHPATTYTVSTPRCTATLPGLTEVITAPRHSSMPCQSGVTYATGCSHPGN